MSRSKHPWCDRIHPSFHKTANSADEAELMDIPESIDRTSKTESTSALIEKPGRSGVAILLGSDSLVCSEEANLSVGSTCTGTENKPETCSDLQQYKPYPCSRQHNRLASNWRRNKPKRTLTFDQSEVKTKTDLTSLDSLHSSVDRSQTAIRLTLQSSNSTDQCIVDKAGAVPSNKGKHFRPILRRAISEANCRSSKEQASGKILGRRQKQPRNRINKELCHNVNRTFDSSILEMPVELLGEMSADTPNWLYGEKSTRGSAEVDDSLVAIDYQPQAEPFRSGILQARSQLEVNRPKSSTSKGIRRMHSTAVDSHYASAIRQRRNREYNLSQTDPIRTVTFHELECPEENHHRLTRNPSLDIFPNVRNYNVSDVQLNSDYSNAASPVLNRSQISHTTENGQTAADKATSTNAFVIPSNSTYSVSAMADGNFIEQGSEYAKQSTSSYLKEQFLAFFQPSDNKLAMKLFGSKNALLKEKRRQEQQGKWVIHPCSSFRFYWDLIMLVLLIANLIILPVAISFFNDDLSIHWIVFNTISDVIFITDIAVKFRTGIVTNDYADEIILNPKEITRHYLKSWFVLDFISSIPMDYIYLIFYNKDHYNQILSAGRTLRILRLAKLLSMLRLLRLTRLVRYVSQWEEFLNIASKFMGIFNLVLLMLLLGHWNACLQYLIPMLMEFPPDSWVKRCKLEDADWFQQYTWALFKAMSHMLSIGYGRFPPISIGDAWITIVSMMSGATCYALFVGHAAALIQSFDTSKRLYREKFKQVEEYMAYRKLPRALRQRIANYYEHRYQGKMFDEAQILNEFSECLREQVINYNCRALVAAVPFFTYADQEFVSEVVTKLKFEVFQPGDLIIKEGTIGNKMYFIQEGIVDIITRDGDVVTSLSDGSYVGEICLLTNVRRTASVKAVVYSNLYSLDRESFLSVLENYPLMRRTMESVAAERLNKIGRNPAIVSDREDLKEDLSLVKEIVSSAVTPEETQSEHDTDVDENPSHMSLRHLLNIRRYKRISRRQETNASGDSLAETNLQTEVEHTSSDKDKPKTASTNPLVSTNILSRLFKGFSPKQKASSPIEPDRKNVAADSVDTHEVNVSESINAVIPSTQEYLPLLESGKSNQGTAESCDSHSQLNELYGSNLAESQMRHME